LTALVGTEPLVLPTRSPHALQLSCSDPLARPADDGVPVLDDTRDRKEGHATDYVARQFNTSAQRARLITASSLSPPCGLMNSVTIHSSPNH
jgi:hypothetical protein